MIDKIINDLNLTVFDYVILDDTNTFLLWEKINIFLRKQNIVNYINFWKYANININLDLNFNITDQDIDMFLWYPFLKKNIIDNKNQLICNKNFDDIKTPINDLLNWILLAIKDNSYIPNYNELKSIFFKDFPVSGKSIKDINEYLINNFVKKSIYKFDEKYLNFLDTWDEIINIYPSILNSILNQNMTTCDTDSPSATFMEISTIINIRKLIWYESSFDEINSSQNIGGCFTIWGMMGNILSILTARNFKYKDTQKKWLNFLNKKIYLLLWWDHSHYSTWTWFWWLWFGEDNVVYIKTNKWIMDVTELEDKIIKIKQDWWEILSIITTLWNPYSMKLDNIKDISNIWKKYWIWIHCDAANWWILIFSKKYKYLVDWINNADSISLDFHKALWLNYPSSLFLCRDKNTFITNISEWNIVNKAWSMDLWMTTPFINSRWFDSLKLWYYINYYWLDFISNKIDAKINNIKILYTLLKKSNIIHNISQPESFWLIFIYIPLDKKNDYLNWLIDEEVINKYQELFKKKLHNDTWISINMYKISGNILWNPNLSYVNVLSIHNSHDYISYSILNKLNNFLIKLVKSSL